MASEVHQKTSRTPSFGDLESQRRRRLAAHLWSDYPVEDNDQAAVTTINRLGLNIRKLQDLRASAIAPFLDDDLTTEEVAAFVAGYLAPSETGNFSPFWTTIQYLFQ